MVSYCAMILFLQQKRGHCFGSLGMHISFLLLLSILLQQLDFIGRTPYPVYKDSLLSLLLKKWNTFLIDMRLCPLLILWLKYRTLGDILWKN